MNRICYTEEFQVLIAEFFIYRNKHWKLTQVINIVSYLIILILSIITKQTPAWGVLLLGQSMVLLIIFRTHKMKQRYEAGFFLSKLIDAMYFREFAIKKKKINEEYIDQEIIKLLRI